MDQGNILSWATSNYELVNMTQLDLTKEELCAPVRPGNVIMPNQRNFTAHLRVCQQFGARVGVVSDAPTQAAMSREVSGHRACTRARKVGGRITGFRGFSYFGFLVSKMMFGTA